MNMPNRYAVASKLERLTEMFCGPAPRGAARLLVENILHDKPNVEIMSVAPRPVILGGLLTGAGALAAGATAQLALQVPTMTAFYAIKVGVAHTDSTAVANLGSGHNTEVDFTVTDTGGHLLVGAANQQTPIDAFIHPDGTEVPAWIARTQNRVILRATNNSASEVYELAFTIKGVGVVPGHGGVW